MIWRLYDAEDDSGLGLAAKRLGVGRGTVVFTVALLLV